MLRNLKVAYARLEAWDAALPVQRRLVALLPDVPDERRDLGLILLRNGHAGASLEHLRAYARQGAEQAKSIRPFLGVAQRMAAEMN